MIERLRITKTEDKDLERLQKDLDSVMLGQELESFGYVETIVRPGMVIPTMFLYQYQNQGGFLIAYDRYADKKELGSDELVQVHADILPVGATTVLKKRVYAAVRKKMDERNNTYDLVDFMWKQ